MLTKTNYRIASLFIMISLILSLNNVAHAASSPSSPTRLAWFYKPPSDGNLANIASQFDFFILTRNDENQRDQLIKLGVTQPILQYLLLDVIQDPGSCTAQPWRNQVAYQIGDFCQIQSQHPDWFLLDNSGKKINQAYGNMNFYVMDPANAGWRAFWLQRASQSQADFGWKGVFLDNMEASLDKLVRDVGGSAKYKTNAEYQTAISAFADYIYKSYFQPQGRPLFANIVEMNDPAVWNRYLGSLDGAMLENFAVGWNNTYSSASRWEQDMKLAEQTQALGKQAILVSQGTQADTSRQRFAYASYLLVANGLANFRYASYDYYDQAWLYDNYTLNLGAPLGKRYQSGAVWKRDFSNGSVSVDPASHAASITLNSALPTATPTSAPALTPTAVPTSVPTSAPTPAPQATINTNYENTDPGFTYTTGWYTVNNANASGGSYKRTAKLKSSASFKFTGSSIAILYVSQPIGGVIKIYIDGKYIQSINQKSSKTIYNNKWQLSANSLAAGTHQLTVTFDSPSGGTVTIDRLTVTSP
jgi:hypothetical protein